MANWKKLNKEFDNAMMQFDKWANYKFVQPMLADSCLNANMIISKKTNIGINVLNVGR